MTANGISYDILEWFPILYCQNVFKYLNGKDLIQASAVNKEWYNLVAEGPQIKKLKLIFNQVFEDELTDEAMNILKKSKRKYENIKLERVSLYRPEFYLEFLAERAGSWKSVTIKKCFHCDLWSELFQIIEPSVEELTLIIPKFGTDRPVRVTSRLMFPRLKSLVCVVSKYNIYKHFLGCQNLVKFHWESDKCRSHMHDEIFTIMSNNYDLKDSHAKASMANESSFKFKLQKIRIDGFATLDNLHLLLKTHAQTLESLEMCSKLKLNQELLELILNMPRLSSFSVDFWSNIEKSISSWNGAFPVNTTIDSIELFAVSFADQNAFETFIRAFPSLKHFKTDGLSNATLSRLAEHVPNLETIETFEFSVTRYPEGNIFPSIKKFKAKYFEERITPTGENKFAALVIKEMRRPYHIWDVYDSDEGTVYDSD